ncbi:MAG TPA: epoxyqueuosine reductase [Spirochaetota bacterium]
MNSQKEQIREIVLSAGADICGIAPQERFGSSPDGFSPKDIYRSCRSVLVFAKRLPVESIHAESCIPYTHINSVITSEVDRLTYVISLALQSRGIKNVIVPSDDPYEYWEGENSCGRAILSLRHAGYLAGLGYLGKSTLLINRTYGNMMQIGALLLETELEGDPLITDECPENCTLCIDNCPSDALDGITVDQKKCRPLSVYRNDKGYVLKKCYNCRKVCPRISGY